MTTQRDFTKLLSDWGVPANYVYTKTGLYREDGIVTDEHLVELVENENYLVSSDPDDPTSPLIFNESRILDLMISFIEVALRRGAPRSDELESAKLDLRRDKAASQSGFTGGSTTSGTGTPGADNFARGQIVTLTNRVADDERDLAAHEADTSEHDGLNQAEVDARVKGQVDPVKTDLATEKTAREAADTKLDERIDGVVAADTKLNERIDGVVAAGGSRPFGSGSGEIAEWAEGDNTDRLPKAKLPTDVAYTADLPKIPPFPTEFVQQVRVHPSGVATLADTLTTTFGIEFGEAINIPAETRQIALFTQSADRSTSDEVGKFNWDARNAGRAIANAITLPRIQQVDLDAVGARSADRSLNLSVDFLDGSGQVLSAKAIPFFIGIGSQYAVADGGLSQAEVLNLIQEPAKASSTSRWTDAKLPTDTVYTVDLNNALALIRSRAEDNDDLQGIITTQRTSNQSRVVEVTATFQGTVLGVSETFTAGDIWFMHPGSATPVFLFNKAGLTKDEVDALINKAIPELTNAQRAQRLGLSLAPNVVERVDTAIADTYTVSAIDPSQFPTTGVWWQVEVEGQPIGNSRTAWTHTVDRNFTIGSTLATTLENNLDDDKHELSVKFKLYDAASAGNELASVPLHITLTPVVPDVEDWAQEGNTDAIPAGKLPTPAITAVVEVANTAAYDAITTKSETTLYFVEAT